MKSEWDEKESCGGRGAGGGWRKVKKLGGDPINQKAALACPPALSEGPVRTGGVCACKCVRVCLKLTPTFPTIVNHPEAPAQRRQRPLTVPHSLWLPTSSQPVGSWLARRFCLH